MKHQMMIVLNINLCVRPLPRVSESLSSADTTSGEGVSHRPCEPNTLESKQTTSRASRILYSSSWDEAAFSWALSLLSWESTSSLHHLYLQHVQVHWRVLLNTSWNQPFLPLCTSHSLNPVSPTRNTAIYPLPYIQCFPINTFSPQPPECSI